MEIQPSSGAGGPAWARVRDALLWPIRWGAEKASLLLWERRTIEGLQLYDATGQGRPELLDRLASALALLAEVDPRRFRRFCQDVPHLLVVSKGVADYYPLPVAG